MAAIMAATYPELFSGIGVHSGLAYGAAHDLPSAFNAMRSGGRAPDIGTRARSVPMIAFHGDRDSTVNRVNGDRLVDQWLGMHDGPGHGRGAAHTVAPEVHHSAKTGAGHAYTRFLYRDDAHRPRVEKWIIHQAGHAWSGGSPSGSYTDPQGPSASAEMVRFFDEHRKGQ